MTRFMKFCVVGFSGAVIDMTFFWFFGGVAGWPIALAKTCGTELAIVNNFVWNDRWTFADAQPRASAAQRLLRFNLVCGAGLLISLALLSFQIGELRMNRYVANAVAIVLVTGWNYGVNRVAIWRAPRVRAAGWQTARPALEPARSR